MRILLATDFSETASRAQGRAVELAHALGAELVLLHVTTDELPIVRPLAQVLRLERAARQRGKQQAAQDDEPREVVAGGHDL